MGWGAAQPSIVLAAASSARRVSFIGVLRIGCVPTLQSRRDASPDEHLKLAGRIAEDSRNGLMSLPAKIRIGSWIASPALNVLENGEQSVRLESRTMDVLVCLATRPGDVISVEEL